MALFGRTLELITDFGKGVAGGAKELFREPVKPREKPLVDINRLTTAQRQRILRDPKLREKLDIVREQEEVVAREAITPFEAIGRTAEPLFVPSREIEVTRQPSGRAVARPSIKALQPISADTAESTIAQKGREYLGGGAAALGLASRQLELWGLKPEITGKVADTFIKGAQEIHSQNPSYWDNFAYSLGTSMPFIGVGVGVGGAVAGAVGATGLATAGVTAMIAREAAVDVASVTEAMIESAAVYEQLNAQGAYSEEEMRRRAQTAFWQNLIAINVLNRFGFFGNQRSFIRRQLMTAGSEALQEMVQQTISNIQTNKPIAEGWYESGSMGGLIGLLFGLATPGGVNFPTEVAPLTGTAIDGVGETTGGPPQGGTGALDITVELPPVFEAEVSISPEEAPRKILRPAAQPAFQTEEGFALAQANAAEQIATRIDKAISERTSGATISRQFLENFTKEAGVKNAEIDVINRTLQQMAGEQINKTEFLATLQTQLLPLKIIEEDMRGNKLTAFSDYSMGAREEQIRPEGQAVDFYRELVLTTPYDIGVSSHFDEYIEKAGAYFSHVRYESMTDRESAAAQPSIQEVAPDRFEVVTPQPEGRFLAAFPTRDQAASYIAREAPLGGTLRINEIQSDLFQKKDAGEMAKRTSMRVSETERRIQNSKERVAVGEAFLKESEKEIVAHGSTVTEQERLTEEYRELIRKKDVDDSITERDLQKVRDKIIWTEEIWGTRNDARMSRLMKTLIASVPSGGVDNSGSGRRGEIYAENIVERIADENSSIHRPKGINGRLVGGTSIGSFRSLIRSEVISEKANLRPEMRTLREDKKVAGRVVREGVPTKLRAYQKGDAWLQRTLRELLRFAARKSYSRALFPTGTTAFRIEGFIEGGSAQQMYGTARIDVGGTVQYIGEEWKVLEKNPDGSFRAVREDEIENSFSSPLLRNDLLDSERETVEENVTQELADARFEEKTEGRKEFAEGEKLNLGNEARKWAEDVVNGDVVPENNFFTIGQGGEFLSLLRDGSSADAAIDKMTEDYVRGLDLNDYLENIYGDEGFFMDGDGFITLFKKGAETEILAAPSENAVADELTFEEVERDFDSAQRAIFQTYESRIPNYLRKIRPDLKKITDENGNTWWETMLTAEDTEPVLAFQRAQKAFNPISREEALKTVRKYFKANEVGVNFVDRVTTPEGQRALGVYFDRMIMFAERPDTTTPEHEVVHAYMDLYATDEQKADVLSQFKAETGITNDREANEALADAFVEYAQGRSTIGGQVRAFFARFWNWLKSFVGKEDKVRKLFGDITAGRRPEATTPFLRPATEPLFGQLARGSQRTVRAFEDSTGQERITNSLGVPIEIGSFGKNALARKTGQKDRFPVSQIPDALGKTFLALRASGDTTSYRYDNIALLSRSGEDFRVVYARENKNSALEVINAHEIPRGNLTRFISELGTVGVPSRTRTDISGLEDQSLVRLAYGDALSVSQQIDRVKGSQIGAKTVQRKRLFQVKDPSSPKDAESVRKRILHRGEELQPKKLGPRFLPQGVGRRAPSPAVTSTEAALLRDKLRAEARGARGARIFTQRQVKDLQGEVVSYIEKNLPLAERGRFIRVIRNTNSVNQLEKTFARILPRVEQYQSLATERKRLSGMRQKIAFISKVGEFKRSLVADAKSQLGIDVSIPKANEDQLDALIVELSNRLKFRRDRGAAPPIRGRGEPGIIPKEIYDDAVSLVGKGPGKVEEAKDAFRNAKKQATKLLEKIVTPISTRLASIDISLKRALRRMEYDIKARTRADMQAVVSFLEKTSKLNEGDYRMYDLAMKNGDIRILADVFEKNGIAVEDYQAFRKVMDGIHKRAVEVDYDLGYRENYSPRMVKDAEGLLEYFGRQEYWSVLDEAIKEKETDIGRYLDVEEKARLINIMLRGFRSGQIYLSRIGSMKERVIDYITPELNEFYVDANKSIVKYIEDANTAIEARRFFGKAVKTNELAKGEEALNLDDSIGAYTANLIVEGKITPTQELELRDLLQSRFGKKGTTGIVTPLKNLLYIGTLGSPVNALTQIGDLGLSMYRGGFFRTLAGTPRALFRRTEIKREDIGIDEIAQEFTQPSTSQKVLQWTFTITGFRKMDAIGKDTLINATLRKWRAQAKRNMPELRRRLEDVFGNETDQVVEDLISGEITENVKYLLFNDLLDTQPVALSEMPEAYLTAGNGRIFYALKTWTLKVLDVYRNDVYSEFAHGSKVKSFQNFIRLTFFLAIMGATADELKDWILGRKTKFGDQIIDNITSLFFLSRYNVDLIQREGILGALSKQLAPPLPKIDSRTIPVVGDLYYWWFGKGSEYKAKEQKKAKGTGVLDIDLEIDLGGEDISPELEIEL